MKIKINKFQKWFWIEFNIPTKTEVRQKFWTKIVLELEIDCQEFWRKIKSSTSSSLNKNNIENKVVRSRSNKNTVRKRRNITRSTYLSERENPHSRITIDRRDDVDIFLHIPNFQSPRRCHQGIKATSWFSINPNYQPLLHLRVFDTCINPYLRLNSFIQNTNTTKTKQINNIQLNKTN